MTPGILNSCHEYVNFSDSSDVVAKGPLTNASEGPLSLER